jgi:tripartite-type tricarboxylate transporter receptor subunit TctC
MKKLTRYWRVALAALPILFTSPYLLAQPDSFPNKPLTIVVPYAAGSAADIGARALAIDMAEILKQPVVVENRTGGNQVVAASYVARAPANGYTMYFALLPSVTAPAIQAKLPYRGMIDFAPVAKVLTIAGFLGVSNDVPANNLKEFIAVLKANPDKYTYGSSGIGSPIHLFNEMFNKEIGAKAVHVPYQSGQLVLMDIVAGRINYGFVPVSAMDFVAQGKLKSMGLPLMQRDSAYPNMPTLDESGMKGFTAALTYTVVTTKGTPPDVIAKLNSTINTVIASDSFARKVKPMGGVEISRPQTPAQTGEFILREEERWNGLVKSANIQLQ